MEVFDWSDMRKFDEVDVSKNDPTTPSKKAEEEPTSKNDDDNKPGDNNQSPMNLQDMGLLDWSDTRKFDLDHDQNMFNDLEEGLAKEFGGDIIKLRYASHGRVIYFCQLCLAECNGRKSLELHCSGMKHLKKKDMWEKEGKPSINVGSQIDGMMGKTESKTLADDDRLLRELSRIEGEKEFMTEELPRRGGFGPPLRRGVGGRVGARYMGDHYTDGQSYVRGGRGGFDMGRREEIGFDRGGRGGFGRGEIGGFGRGERGGFDRGERGGFDRGERGGFDRGEIRGFGRGERGGFDRGEIGGFDRGERGDFDRGGFGREERSGFGRGGSVGFERGRRGYDNGGRDSERVGREYDGLGRGYDRDPYNPPRDSGPPPRYPTDERYRDYPRRPSPSSLYETRPRGFPESGRSSPIFDRRRPSPVWSREAPAPPPMPQERGRSPLMREYGSSDDRRYRSRSPTSLRNYHGKSHSPHSRSPPRRSPPRHAEPAAPPAPPPPKFLDKQTEKASLVGSPAGALLKKLSECCVKSSDDADLALQVVSALIISLREYSERNGETKIAELLKEAELKIGTFKALKVGMQMLSSIADPSLAGKVSDADLYQMMKESQEYKATAAVAAPDGTRASTSTNGAGSVSTTASPYQKSYPMGVTNSYPLITTLLPGGTHDMVASPLLASTDGYPPSHAVSTPQTFPGYIYPYPAPPTRPPPTQPPPPHEPPPTHEPPQPHTPWNY